MTKMPLKVRLSIGDLNFSGKDISFSKLSSASLASFVKNRDQQWSWDFLGGNGEGLAKILRTDLTNGLACDDLDERRKQFVQPWIY